MTLSTVTVALGAVLLVSGVVVLAGVGAALLTSGVLLLAAGLFVLPVRVAEARPRRVDGFVP